MRSEVNGCWWTFLEVPPLARFIYIIDQAARDSFRRDGCETVGGYDEVCCLFVSAASNVQVCSQSEIVKTCFVTWW